MDTFEVKETELPNWGKTQSGYSLQNGSPTHYMIKLSNEKFWRRIMVLCFSNNGSIFYKYKGKNIFLSDSDLSQKLNDQKNLIGYIIHHYGEGSRVECIDCAKSCRSSTPKIKLYRQNIGQYWQSCHACQKILVKADCMNEPKFGNGCIWCELYSTPKYWYK